MRNTLLYLLLPFMLFGTAQTIYAKGTIPNSTTDDLAGLYIKVGTGIMKCSKFKAGGGYSEKKPNLIPLFNLGIGHKISESFRSDLDLHYGEMLYKGNKSTQKSNMIGVLATGHYDIISVSKTTTPYVSVGAGFSRNHAGTLINNVDPQRKVYPGKNKTDFAWNVGLGVKFNIDQDYTLDLGYRYAYFGEIKMGDHVSESNIVSPGKAQKIKGHQGLLSLLYKF